jgi:hypothetical protein
MAGILEDDAKKVFERGEREEERGIEHFNKAIRKLFESKLPNIDFDSEEVSEVLREFLTDYMSKVNLKGASSALKTHINKKLIEAVGSGRKKKVTTVEAAEIAEVNDVEEGDGEDSGPEEVLEELITPAGQSDEPENGASTTAPDDVTPEMQQQAAQKNVSDEFDFDFETK